MDKIESNTHPIIPSHPYPVSPLPKTTRIHKGSLNETMETTLPSKFLRNKGLESHKEAIEAIEAIEASASLMYLKEASTSLMYLNLDL